MEYLAYVLLFLILCFAIRGIVKGNITVDKKGMKEDAEGIFNTTVTKVNKFYAWVKKDNVKSDLKSGSEGNSSEATGSPQKGPKDGGDGCPG